MATSVKDSAKTGVTPRKAPARPARSRAAKPAAATKPAMAKLASDAVTKVTDTVADTGIIKAVADKAGEARAGITRAVSAAMPKPAPKRARSAPAAAKRGSTATAAKSGARNTGVGTGTMIGVAAAGLAAGLVANLGRKAAVQAPSVMAGDWMEALKAEHKAALALLDQMGKTTANQPARRTLLLAQLKHALGKHAFTEENVIYPALREWGDKADADHLNHDQGYHKQFLYELDGMDKASPEFSTRVADFRADLENHIREEEDKIFPQIHKALTAEKNKTLTALANREGFKLA